MHKISERISHRKWEEGENQDKTEIKHKQKG